MCFCGFTFGEKLFFFTVPLQPLLKVPLPMPAQFTMQTPEALWSLPTLGTACWARAVTGPTLWKR